ncbi:MAG TPA: PEGA domain-containing protein [Polyangia bacterium]|nr:PEGA domain-containing protein [Polyangia bacterium]
MKRITVLALLLTVARTSYAADDIGADALIAKGLELRRAGKSVEAVEILQQANEVAPTPRSAGQLGLAQSAVEHWEDAEQHLNTSLASSRDPWVRNHRPLLEQALTLVESHMGQIALTGPAGAAVVISGKPAGTLPLAKPVRVNAGSALVTATASGFKQFEMAVPVETGKETQLKIVLEPTSLPPAPAPPPATPAAVSPLHAREIEPQSTWRTWTGASLVGVGLGVATWGIVWIAVDRHSSSGSCSAGASADCVPVYNTKTAGYVLTGVGVAAAAAGAIVLYSGRPHGGEVSLAVGPSSVRLAGHF